MVGCLVARSADCSAVPLVDMMVAPMVGHLVAHSEWRTAARWVDGLAVSTADHSVGMTVVPRVVWTAA